MKSWLSIVDRIDKNIEFKNSIILFYWQSAIIMKITGQVT